jgi:hypothetical protein
MVMRISLDFAFEGKRNRGSCEDEQHPDGEAEGEQAAIGVGNGQLAEW